MNTKLRETLKYGLLFLCVLMFTPYYNIIFFILFLLELRFLNFKHKRDKYIWTGIILMFSYIGYSLFLVFKRRLITKRKFQPDFNRNNIKIG